jgi:hypothetical protein
MREKLEQKQVRIYRGVLNILKKSEGFYLFI